MPSRDLAQAECTMRRSGLVSCSSIRYPETRKELRPLRENWNIPALTRPNGFQAVGPPDIDGLQSRNLESLRLRRFFTFVQNDSWP